MTRIDFHFNVSDKLFHVCRLVRKALDKTSTVVVTGDADVLARLDEMLWSFSPIAFLGHVHLQKGASGQKEETYARVWLTTSPQQSQRHDLLINLSDSVTVGFEQYERLIEVVSQDDHDRQHARKRWRHYSTRGYSITQHAINEVKTPTL